MKSKQNVFQSSHGTFQRGWITFSGGSNDGQTFAIYSPFFHHSLRQEYFVGSKEKNKIQITPCPAAATAAPRALPRGMRCSRGPGAGLSRTSVSQPRSSGGCTPQSEAPRAPPQPRRWVPTPGAALNGDIWAGFPPFIHEAGRILSPSVTERDGDGMPSPAPGQGGMQTGRAKGGCSTPNPAPCHTTGVPLESAPSRLSPTRLRSAAEPSASRAGAGQIPRGHLPCWALI